MVRRLKLRLALPSLTAIVLGLTLGEVAAQTGQGVDLALMRTRLQQRYEMLPLRDGIALVPRFTSAVRSIEVTGGTIAVDGIEVTGGDLRRRLGADADLVLQLSYLDAPSRLALLGSPPGAPSVETAAPARETPPARAARRRGNVVRLGGAVTVAADETTDDVAVIGGDATIEGKVDGDLVVVGGSARLGPHAEIRRDVTVVGGALVRDPGAIIGGRVQEVGSGSFPRSSGPFRRAPLFRRLWTFGGLTPGVRLAGTLVRVVVLFLLAGIVMLLARTPVERIAERAAAEPIKAGVVGVLAELVFVPVLLITAVLLAISIVGIPLLPLVPLAVVAFVVVLLVGFTGVAYWLGRKVEVALGRSPSQPYLATVLGIALIVTPLVVGRVVGLAGSLTFVAVALVAVGVLLEYVGWTVGLGAAALVRFGPPLSTPEAVGGGTLAAG